MRPRRTPETHDVFRLEGGNEDNDLWVSRKTDEFGNRVLESVWQPSAEELEVLAAGGCVRLVVWGPGTPPVAVGVYDGPLGARVH